MATLEEVRQRAEQAPDDSPLFFEGDELPEWVSPFWAPRLLVKDKAVLDSEEYYNYLTT